MPFIEAPTTFYLGKRYDPGSNRLTEEIVYYDSRDLTTHAVVVGMTGSGKTGLCINLLEEAVLDNIPAIVIDPKGDITNLMLSFPNLQPGDFEPWVNQDDARRAGLNNSQYAADVAQRWRDGLQSWGIVPDRLKWLRLAAKYSIYTPGSDAGLPISVLASLRAPREGFQSNEEANREKINGIVTALLSLIGKSVRPTEDAEHVLMANIFEHNWRQGRDLTLEDIILQVQQPPFEKLGVFPVDQYMSEKKRYNLAMELNNIIAAPSFQSWVRGEPLDIQNLLYQPNGRPRVSIFYIAHLTEAERTFIITLLLENLLSWMRTLSGTSSLRSILYIDEMFGYFPPAPKNPPTKDPMLRLLKQARAFGLGMVLATQNPGDLDYKGLSNAGTWFIGRLQSDNDRKKVMSGLESLASADASLDMKEAEQLIADIQPRVFLMHNVHNDGGPVLVHTRWAMSYLRGPLTRQQVRILMASQRGEVMQRYQQQIQAPYNQAFAPPPQQGQQGYQQYSAPQQQYAPPPPPPMPGQYGQQPPPNLPGQQQQYGQQPPPNLPGQQQQYGQNFNAQSAPYPPQYSGPTVPPNQVNFPPSQDTGATVVGGGGQDGVQSSRPALPSAISQYFIPVQVQQAQALQQWEQRTGFSARGVGGANLTYKPVVLGQAVVRYQDKKTQLFTARHYAFMIEDLPSTGLIHWEDYVSQPIEARSVAGEPEAPNALYQEVPASMQDDKRLKSMQKEMVDMLYNTANLTLPFNPHLKIYGNPDQEFSAFQATVHQAAREQRDIEVDKITDKYEKLMDRLDDKLRRKVRELQAERKELSDRKREELFTTGEAVLSLLRGRTTYTLSRASRTTRMRRQTSEDLGESEEVIDELEAEMRELEQQFEAELNQINEKWVSIANTVEDYVITPYKKDIHIELFGVGWLPFWRLVVNGQPTMINAR